MSGDQRSWRDTARELIEFARRRRSGDYEVDEFGYDEDFTRTVMVPPLAWKEAASALVTAPMPPRA